MCLPSAHQITNCLRIHSASLSPGMTPKFRQRGQLLSAEVTAQPLFSPKPGSLGKRGAFTPHTHTHVTLALAQRASSSEHGAGRQAAPGERGQGALGQEAEGSWPKCRGREQGNGNCRPQSWGWSLREEAAAGAVGGGSGSGPRVSTESLCGQEANVLITGKEGSEVSKGDGRMAKFLAGEEMPAKVKQK